MTEQSRKVSVSIVMATDGAYGGALDMKTLPSAKLLNGGALQKMLEQTKFAQQSTRWNIKEQSNDGFIANYAYKNGYRIFCGFDRVMVEYRYPEKSEAKDRSFLISELAKEIYEIAQNETFSIDKLGINLVVEVVSSDSSASLFGCFLRQDLPVKNISGGELRLSSGTVDDDPQLIIKIAAYEDEEVDAHGVQIELNRHHELGRTQGKKRFLEILTRIDDYADKNDAVIKELLSAIGS